MRATLILLAFIGWVWWKCKRQEDKKRIASIPLNGGGLGWTITNTGAPPMTWTL